MMADDAVWKTLSRKDVGDNEGDGWKLNNTYFHREEVKFDHMQESRVLCTDALYMLVGIVCVHG